MADRFTREATPEKWRLQVRYLRSKADEHDWHGVMDAAADLRELEAANPALAELDEQPAQKGQAMLDVWADGVVVPWTDYSHRFYRGPKAHRPVKKARKRK